MGETARRLPQKSRVTTHAINPQRAISIGALAHPTYGANWFGVSAHAPAAHPPDCLYRNPAMAKAISPEQANARVVGTTIFAVVPATPADLRGGPDTPDTPDTELLNCSFWCHFPPPLM